jgi:hypothetical protein
LDHHLSILKNQTTTNGAWVAVELIGVESERDAIGAAITVDAGGEKWVHQRLAGNGFECTNESFVHLGLGKLNKIDALEIQWPSGKTSRWENLEVNRRYRVVESQETIDDVRINRP